MNNISRFATIILIFSLYSCKSIPIGKQRILARECRVYSMMYSDYTQTMDITRSQGEYKESNRILGSNPTGNEVKRYFILMGLIHTGIAYILPEDYSKVWQSYFMINHVKAVLHNERIGLDSDTEIDLYIEYKWKF